MKKIIKPCLLFSAMAFPVGVMAADVNYDYEPTPFEEVSISDFYIGGSYGNTLARLDDTKDKGWQAFTGVTLWRTLGVELGHVKFGELSHAGEAADLSSTYARLTLNIPLGNQFYFAANGGWQAWEADANEKNADGDDKTFGVGLNYRFEHNLILRVGAQRYFMNEEKVDFNSVGVAVYF